MIKEVYGCKVKMEQYPNHPTKENLKLPSSINTNLSSSYLYAKNTDSKNQKTIKQVKLRHRKIEIDGCHIEVARKSIEINGSLFETDANPIISR